MQHLFTMKRRRLFILGFIVHVILLISIFDIYFKSPLVPDVAPVKNDVETPADRVVFISADGLRFDSLFDSDPVSGEAVAPYIQEIMRERGSWGISQSREPTESRPAHVAMLAGFYEDPSAFTRGWKENPVDFNSIFHSCVCSFAWGNPEVLSAFSKGLNRRCVYNESYSKDEKNFSGNAIEYDNWVYRKLESFVQNPRHNTVLHKKGIFFFLHFFSLDIVRDKPHTFEYRKKVKNMDELVKKIETLFNTFYGDNATSFIFTSDHGLTDSGWHGTGDPTEIKTPFVAWGAGIKRLQSFIGINIDQVDIAPLLAVLLGVPIPVNSIGVLPVSYLNASEKTLAKAVLLNAEQMSAQFHRTMTLVKEQSITWLYSPFIKLSGEEFDPTIKLISLHIDNNEIAKALQKSKILIDLCLEGLDYYHNYYQRPLLIAITLSYFGWIVYLILELLSNKDKSLFSKSLFLTSAFMSCVLLTLILITVQRLPITYYFYFSLPEFLWFLVFQKSQILNHTLKHPPYLVFIGVLLIGVEILVAVFFMRWVLSISVGIILVWSMSSLTHPKSFLIVTVLWIASGIVLLIFPFVPISEGEPNIFLIFSSGIFLFLFALVTTYYHIRKENSFLFAARCVLIASSVLNSLFIHNHFNFHQEVPGFNQTLSWCLFFISLIFPFFGSCNMMERLPQIFMDLSVPFILSSTNHECFFLATLYVNLFCWIYIESFININSNVFPRSAIGVSDFRRAYFFLCYIWLSFFGIGNIASVNSMNRAWVRCFFSTEFQILSNVLIIFKTLIPILGVACTMRTLIVSLDLKFNRMFIIVLIYCNIMGLNFLYFIKNKGSWLDIGTSITYYVIQQNTAVFVILIHGIAKYLMSASFLYFWQKTESFLPSYFSAKNVLQ